MAGVREKVSEADKNKKPITMTCYWFGCYKMQLIADIPATSKMHKLHPRRANLGGGGEGELLTSFCFPFISVSPKDGQFSVVLHGCLATQAFQLTEESWEQKTRYVT